MPVGGLAGVAAGIAADWRQQERDAHDPHASEEVRSHALSGRLQLLSAGAAVVGLGCAVAGFFFPPLAVVGAAVLAVSEVLFVAAVAIDVVVAVRHPTRDNWVRVGQDAVAVAIGYAVGKVILGPALKALQKSARQLLEREATEVPVLLPKTGQAVDEAIAAQAQREAELLRQLEQSPARVPRPARPATSHQHAKIGQIRKKYKIDKDQNIAYTEGTVNGKPYEEVSHSGYKKDRLGTVEHTPVNKQKLETHPTKADIEKAARQGKKADPTRRAHDSETKILEDLLRKTKPNSKGNIILTSERTVCESCEGAIEQFRILRLGIKIRVSHAVIK